WIKNDSTVASGSKDRVEDFIDANSCMSVCADLCNGSKHLELRQERSNKHPKFGTLNVSLKRREDKPDV
ncbi:unnamed protein product, partial [marine sediment metagenome]